MLSKKVMKYLKYQSMLKGNTWQFLYALKINKYIKDFIL